METITPSRTSQALKGSSSFAIQTSTGDCASACLCLCHGLCPCRYACVKRQKRSALSENNKTRFTIFFEIVFTFMVIDELLSSASNNCDTFLTTLHRRCELNLVDYSVLFVDRSIYEIDFFNTIIFLFFLCLCHSHFCVYLSLSLLYNLHTNK